MYKPTYYVGRWYYIVITARNLSGTLNLTLTLQQDRQVTLLKDKLTIPAKMLYPLDFVHYFYYTIPKIPTNYTFNLSL